ncbi:hypothetical protein FKM82_017991 [Ascaphus truei]
MPLTQTEYAPFLHVGALCGIMKPPRIRAAPRYQGAHCCVSHVLQHITPLGALLSAMHASDPCRVTPPSSMFRASGEASYCG